MDLYKILDFGVTAFIAVYAIFTLGGKMNEIVIKLTYLEGIILRIAELNSIEIYENKRSKEETKL
jgi:hypothetical protein